ncbi:MAG: DUF3341 domain-containing protein [Planctomycetota bacterium]|nr:DUF3341 domain-containing protein [Planctomycetota bacterium]
MAEFEDVDGVIAAANKVRTAGYSNWDVHSPFAIHGIEKAMGIRPTYLPWITLTCGLTGMFLGLFGVWYANATSFPGLPATFTGYQFLISGKPIFSLPANIPIIFECTIAFSAFSTVIGMLALNRLPMHYNPVFKSDRFRRVTSDRFMVVIRSQDPRYDAVATPRFLQGLGARHIEVIRD